VIQAQMQSLLTRSVTVKSGLSTAEAGSALPQFAAESPVNKAAAAIVSLLLAFDDMKGANVCCGGLHASCGGSHGDVCCC
jgi:hypothetical protein